jgi:hypothetical protein
MFVRSMVSVAGVFGRGGAVDGGDVDADEVGELAEVAAGGERFVEDAVSADGFGWHA